MPSELEAPSYPAWTTDRLDSSLAPQSEAPYYDDALEAWVLSRHADVLAALRTPQLLQSGIENPEFTPPAPDEARREMRAEATEALSQTVLQQWRKETAAEAESAALRLPVNRPVDLLEEYRSPLCLSLAVRVTGIALPAAKRLCPVAHVVSAAAAEPADPKLRQPAEDGLRELRPHFGPGPEVLRASGFVTFTEILPDLLANLWYALATNPDQWAHLHRAPELLDGAIEELMRYAGLVRVVARVATEDFDFQGIQMRKGDRMLLRILAANRDPERFADPNRLDVARRSTGHVSFGSGRHFCVGAGLIRMVATALTAPLVRRFSSAELSQPVEWKGGAGFLAPKALVVSLTAVEQDPR